MLSIELKADRDTAAAALNRLQLCTVAVSLGDAETLVEHAASMTHSTYTKEELAASGISEGAWRIPRTSSPTSSRPSPRSCKTVLL